LQSPARKSLCLLDLITPDRRAPREPTLSTGKKFGKRSGGVHAPQRGNDTMPNENEQRRTATGLKLALRDVRAFRKLARLRSLRRGKAISAQSISRALALNYLKRHRREVDEALALEREPGSQS
jgi:hypothetical protein